MITVTRSIARHPHHAIAVAVCLVLASVSAQAQQQTSDARLQEVIVSATKVGEQQLSNVPMAIQAFTGESLQSKGVKDAKDLMALIPGAPEQSEIGAGYKVFSFRG